jgi:hypothetical protein
MLTPLTLCTYRRAFYRARVPEYDEWWQHRGRYDQGPQDATEWHRQVAQVTRTLAQLEPIGNALELAGGSGWWSQYLAVGFDRLIVADSSREALTINRQRGAANSVQILHQGGARHGYRSPIYQ